MLLPIAYCLLPLALPLAAASGQERDARWPMYVEAGPVVTSTLYADGSEVRLPSWTVWRLISGSDPTGIDEAWLKRVAETHHRAFDGSRPVTIVSGPGDGDKNGDGGKDGSRSRGLDIVFNLSGEIPDGAADALEAAAVYIESQFADPATVTIDITFEDLGETIIGQAGFVITTPPADPADQWTVMRSAWVADMDADDTIQDWLPAGSTVPVRWDAGTSAVSDVSQAWLLVGNYEAMLGTHSSSTPITFNSQFPFDYDPSDGMTEGTWCFQTVVVHEVGHALGFFCVLDFFPGSAVSPMDLFRFQRTDGAGADWNPDTLAEFATTARTIDFNNLDDDVISDLVSVEYRMADGDPYQPSHFRRQTARIGIMSPTLGSGETLYPNFYRRTDLALLDAIGWDYVGPALGDLDNDGDVDSGDFALFADCLAGPDNPPAGGCPPGVDADLDGDGDVDLHDFAAFAQNFTGSQ